MRIAAASREEVVRGLTLVKSRLLLVRHPDEEVRNALKAVRGLIARLGVVHRGGDPEEQRAFDALLLATRRATPVEDCPLAIKPSAVVCVSRQLAVEAEAGKGPAVDPKSSRAKRGRAPLMASCRVEMCPAGAVVRAAIGDDVCAIEMARRAPRAKDE
jgi:hypothetical protein